MTRPFVLWGIHDPRVHDLQQPARLASWDAKNSPAQVALQRYLDVIQDLVHGSPQASALHLTVHEPGPESRGRGRDLDNYLYPVVHRLGANRFHLARATKTADTVERLTVGDAVRDDSVVAGERWQFASATTTASSDTRAWKQQVHEQIAAATRSSVSSPGPVALELAFRVGPTRTWANLWKPAIDSLGPILGEGHRPFNPRDDTIVALGLHREVVHDLGNRVEVGIWSRSQEA